MAYNKHNLPLKPALSLDETIATFALNLEYWEAEYYMRGTFGSGLSSNLGAGAVDGGKKVKFTNKAFKGFAQELAENELAHVKMYRRILGSKAIDAPPIDFERGFRLAAQAAGLVKPGESFDPFDNEIHFFLGGYLFEDVGVTAYTGAVPLIKDKQLQGKIAGVLATESHHMGLLRGLLYQAGPKAIKAANAIAMARKSINGSFEQGISNPDGSPNFVPTDKDATTFARTPREVMDIVFLKKGADYGGFYPEGLNGNFEKLM